VKKTIANLVVLIHSASPLAVLAALLFLTPTETHAVKLSVEMTPDNLQEPGFSTQVKKLKEGTVEFSLSRDLSKTRSFEAGSELRLRRSATVKIIGQSGLIASCDVEPKLKNTTLTYRIVMAQECVPNSQFTLAETEDYKEEVGAGYMGGGTMFEFRLALFAEQLARVKRP
jgi:hypothetical protein